MFTHGFISCHVEYDQATRTYVNRDAGRIGSVQLYADFANREAAEKFAARAPKSCKLRISTYYNSDKVSVFYNERLHANKSTGEKNETALKRLAKVVALFGNDIDEASPTFNKIVNSASVAELKAFLARQ